MDAMELRVHGVGGTSPESMLGSCGAPPVVAWRSDPAARSKVYRRADLPGVFAYHWAPLTSGSRWFALWPLLLPFTLSNVAGFMTSSERGVRAAVFRTAAVLQAMALTATATWWAWAGALLVLQGVDLPDWIPGARRTWAALFLGAVLMAILVLAATYGADGFERYRRSTWATEQPSRPWGRHAFTDLTDTRFYDNGRAHAARWYVHILVVLLAGAGAVVWVSASAGGSAAPMRPLGWLVAAGTGVSLVAALVRVAAAGTRRAAGLGWRFLAPAVTIAATVVLGGLVLSVCLWVVSIGALPPGPLVLWYDAYGWAVGATIVAAAACLAWQLMTRSPGEPVRTPERALPTSAGRWLARLSTTLGHAYVMIVTFAGTFLVATIVTLVRNRHHLDGYRLTNTPPVALARWTFALLIAFLFINVIRSRAAPDSLRRVGTIWDILTFWPRTFHPLAVRCYAERAVPELQDLLDQPERTPVVLVGHSQGSVLAYAAIRPLLMTPEGRDQLADWALVTVGCPLRALYARAFPRYFPVSEFDAARAALDGRWRNLFRFTDYVGRAVFVSDEVAAAPSAPDAPGGDRWLPDPGSPGTPVHAHSHYWEDPRVRCEVRDILNPAPAAESRDAA
jgi:hypothetical protein